MERIRAAGRGGTRIARTVERAADVTNVAAIAPMVALLVRHAHTDAIGTRLVGRLSGVPLSPRGRAQATRLGRALATSPLDAIYSSPLERALDTAQAIAGHHGLRVDVRADLNEIDFGDWTGLTFDELGTRPDWRAFNERRPIADVPRGERAAAVQRRILEALAGLALRHAGQRIAIVSHADVLRAALLHYASIPLDRFHAIELDPASVTAVSIRGGQESATILSVNDGAAPA